MVSKGAPERRRPLKADVRAGILAAAARLFAERGIPGASLDDIAAAAGYSKGAIYSNFSSKDDLVLQLMDQALDNQLSSVRSQLSGDLDLAEMLSVLTTEATLTRTGPNPVFALTSEFRQYAMRTPALLPEFIRRRGEAYAGVRGILETHLAKHPEISLGMPTETVAIVVVTVVIGMAFDQPALDVSAGSVLASLLAALVRPA